MSERQKHLLDWLRDAHAMERQAEQMLKAEIKRIEHYPELKTKLEDHLTRTLDQQRLLEGCIVRLGGKTSAIKDITGKIMAFGQGLTGMMVSDEVIKGAMSCYVFEQMEIVSYTILIQAAETCGDSETKAVCERILAEEREMAAWLMAHMDGLVSTFLQRAATPGETAKR